MSKDVILDKYARLYELPNQLALLGHQVDCYCLSYQHHENGFWDDSNESKQLKWYSKSYKNWKKIQILTYPFKLLEKLKLNKPDVILAASDIPHIIMGAWLANKLDIPFVADLYDNFEAYGQAKIPFIKALSQLLGLAPATNFTIKNLISIYRERFINPKLIKDNFINTPLISFLSCFKSWGKPQLLFCYFNC